MSRAPWLVYIDCRTGRVQTYTLSPYWRGRWNRRMEQQS